MDDIEQIDSEITPKRTHYTQTELKTIQTLIDDGCSTREIATKMDRSLSGIRNLRHRLDLTQKIQDEILPTLRAQEKDLEENLLELTILSEIRSKAVKDLQHRKEELTEQVKTIKEEYTNLKQAVDYYYTHREKIRQELETFIQGQADVTAIQKIFQWLEDVK